MKVTHDRPWNTHGAMLVVKRGTTVRIINDDDEPHTLHTDGVPCPHGEEMEPGGGHYDCGPVSEPFDPENDGPLHDHVYGPGAAFWLKVR